MPNTRPNKNIPTEQENPLFHDTWKLLKNYRDAVWNLELAVQQVRSTFEIEYGSSIEEFLDSIYLAGADIGGSKLEDYAKSIERSNKMLTLLNSAVDILRSKHKHGEQYYWILYYSYLSPQQLQNTDEIIESLRPHIANISTRTYYRKRRRQSRHSAPSCGDTPQKTALRCWTSSFRQGNDRLAPNWRTNCANWHSNAIYR